MGELRKAFYKFYSTAQGIIAPGLRNSQYPYKEKMISLLRQDSVWLDLGCGHQLLPDWMPGWEREQSAIIERAGRVFGIDCDLPSLVKHTAIRNRVMGDTRRLPFGDNSFDLVTANVVVEHVEDPGEMLEEIRRVLKPGGRFLFHTPNLWSYATLTNALLPRAVRLPLIRILQGRKKEDVFPTHYRFNSLGAAKSLAEQHGLVVSELQFVESSAQTVMLGPFVVLELLWIAAVRLPIMKKLRTNLIAVLQKPARAGDASRN